jgi:hypothetical protein
MASLPIHAPIADHLLTPQNAALVVITEVREIMRGERLLKA